MPDPSLTQALASLTHQLGTARPGPIRIGGLRGSAGAMALARIFAANPRPIAALLATSTEAEAFATDLRFYLGDQHGRDPLARRVHFLPGWEIPPFEPLSPTRETVAARAEGFFHLLQTPTPIVVTTAEGWAQRCLSRAAFTQAITYVVTGEALAPETLLTRLLDWGYHRVPLVQDPGDVALRGGLLDVFPAGYTRPVRIEFFGDDVEKMRGFDAESQRSLDALEEVLLLPMREFGLSRLTPAVAEAIDSRAGDLAMARNERRDLVEAIRNRLVLPGHEQLLPYLYDDLTTLPALLPKDTLLWVGSSNELESTLDTLWRQIEEHAATAERDGRFHPAPADLYLDPDGCRTAIEQCRRIEADALDVLADGALHATAYTTESLTLKSGPGPDGPLGGAVKRLKEWQHEGNRVVLVAGTEVQKDRLRVLLAGHQVEVTMSTAPFPQALTASPLKPIVMTGGLSTGVWLPADRLVVVTEAEIFGERRQVRRIRRAKPQDIFSSLAELKPDDYVVHVDHGVGLYRGLRHMTIADLEGDFLHLEYLGGDRLYLPVDRINLVQRYVGAEGGNATLDKLGGDSWIRVKAKTKESILAMAHELIKLYAARDAHGRPPLATGDALYQEFCARFPFEETPDQARAIEEVANDLGSERPMDRLVCGDVGFGKTEVAMRAAFMAVIAGKQVAVLVPTTILAQQHLENFRKRFEGYPVRMEMLSRFRTAAENKAAVGELADGRLDIVIGTHRLIQKDVKFERLGLLIIDEEHRFGVKDKERIRAMRSTVDVLTLTATPIPRTLNMSLSGLRDLSVIETPPVDRLAIRTYVTKYDESVIRDAIIRELNRKGQVFFVHNRVETIERMATRLREIVPEAKLDVAHGQMGEALLEKTMLAFMHGETNVLVTSAIIESGLDIPSANTVIINRADSLGLAQLYQIRGRVGRSHQRAYAYLLIPGEHLITSDAQKRLHVLQELDDLGGGFRLAAHDLEIRGAGNLLGKQQSGQITAVGLELYAQMMEQAVRELRGQRIDESIEPEIQLGFAAFIPDGYIPDVSQRLVAYKRLAGVRGPQDIDEIAAEFEDRYGPIPPLVDSLLKVMELRRWLKDLRILRARKRGDGILFEFDESTPVTPEKLLEVIRGTKGKLKLTSGSALLVHPEATDSDALVAELRGVLQKVSAR
jgi:transcription-repair coupling factor (superfamily II helicase)